MYSKIPPAALQGTSERPRDVFWILEFFLNHKKTFIWILKERLSNLLNVLLDACPSSFISSSSSSASCWVAIIPLSSSSWHTSYFSSAQKCITLLWGNNSHCHLYLFSPFMETIELTTLQVRGNSFHFYVPGWVLVLRKACLKQRLSFKLFIIICKLNPLYSFEILVFKLAVPSA